MTEELRSAQPSEPQVGAHAAPQKQETWIIRWLSHPVAPIVVGMALLCAAGFALMGKFSEGSGFGRQAVVLFDPVKFVNAQRAAASFLAMNQNQDLALTMTQVAKKAEEVIREEAGGAIVLVKQTVVVPAAHMVDITDAVLERFGLPTTVPTVTVNPDKLVLDQIAPTDSALSSGALREDYIWELQQSAKARNAQVEKQNQQEKMLP